MFSKILVSFLLFSTINSSYVKNCKCGTNFSVTPRIVGGTELSPHEHPWLVAIFMKGYLLCGGTLINNKYVITAGHCVKWLKKSNKIIANNRIYSNFFLPNVTIKTSNLVVALGLHHLDNPQNVLITRVKRVIVHGGFTSHLLHDTNDIALLELTTVVVFRNNIQPICLPHPSANYAGVVTIASGWGLGADKTISKLPMKVELKVMNKSFCLDSVIGDQFTDGMLCAYYEGRDSCQGDSGGPLVYKRLTGSYEIIGIVSWGIGCGEKEIPSVYTKITKYLRWIEKETLNGVYCAINY